MRRAKKDDDTFIIERKIDTNFYDEVYLEQKLTMCHRLYNTSVRHCIKQLEEMRQDIWFQTALTNYFKAKKGTSERVQWKEEVDCCIEAYGLTEVQIQQYMGYQRIDSLNEKIGSNICQKLATELAKPVRKAIFKGTKIHFHKYGQTNSFEDKKATSGIIYNPEKETVKVMGRVMKLKPIREKDTYIQEALENRVKYCRITRKPFKNGYKYFLQLVMDGVAPKKLNPGKGKCGLDEGTSTVACYTDKETNFYVLAEDVEKYDKEIIKYQRKYERSRRINNPENYNEDGTIKKGSKFKNTKNNIKNLMKLKDAYRRKSVYVRQKHNYLINRLIEQCDTFVKEPMDFRALAKRAKETSKQDKASTIKKKDGTEIQVHKYKRKKRFGSSINRRSPGYFNARLEFQIKKYGGTFIDVDKFNYKASQYNHKTQEATKSQLSERSKYIGKYLVQRDLYSSFLLYHNLDVSHIDFVSCNKDFRSFLRKQRILVSHLKNQRAESSLTDVAYRNFGLDAF